MRKKPIRPTEDNIIQQGWTLIDAEAMHQQYPTSFEIPCELDRKNRVRGDSVKLIFDLLVPDENNEINRFGERMWTIVLGRENDSYIGALCNHPSVFQPGTGFLQVGCYFYFEPKHIIDTYHQTLSENDILEFLNEYCE